MQPENNRLKPLPTYGKCFVCGQSNQRGLKVPFFTDGKTARAAFTPDLSLLGYGHAVHGGILGTLLDEALIWGCYVQTGRFGVTAEITIRYLKPLVIETECIVIGEMVENKGKIWMAEADIRNQAGCVYARAKGKIIPMTEEQNRELMRGLD